MDWHQTSKIKLRKILEYRIDTNGINPIDPWSAKIVSVKFLKTAMFENLAPQKFGAVRYTAVLLLTGTNFSGF